jgi:hypothetical protein
MSSPIASYTEVIYGLRRQIDLFPGHLSIRGGLLSQPVRESIVKLARLQPSYHRRRMPHPGFFGIMMLALLLWGALWFCFRRSNGPIPESLSTLLVASAIATTIAAVALSRPIEFAVFAGPARIWIAREGPDSNSFDMFVARVANQIEYCAETGNRADAIDN